MDHNEYAALLLGKIRTQKPLIHNITNYVVMNYTANALLACGASPVMAHAYNEVNEMTSIAHALVINIGTLDNEWIHSMLIAAGVACSNKIPVILDPVGAGATTLRTNTAIKIINSGNVSVIRGNASEIMALAVKDVRTKGVDALHSAGDAVDVAKTIATQYKTIVAITGPTDIITDGIVVVKVHNGHKLMSYVTGTGCTATALIGAFCAVDNDYLKATASALAYFGVAGELAARKAIAPGSFMIRLIDELYSVTPDELKQYAKIEIG